MKGFSEQNMIDLWMSLVVGIQPPNFWCLMWHTSARVICVVFCDRLDGNLYLSVLNHTVISCNRDNQEVIKVAYFREAYCIWVAAPDYMNLSSFYSSSKIESSSENGSWLSVYNIALLPNRDYQLSNLQYWNQFETWTIWYLHGSHDPS